MEYDSLPHWAEVINKRIRYHEDGYNDARLLDDYDSADGHQLISDELVYILELLGLTAR